MPLNFYMADGDKSYSSLLEVGQLSHFLPVSHAIKES